MAAPDRIAVVTVHGTGDTAPGPDGDKWFQNGSVFTERLKARLAAQGLEADIHPLLWSGANSASEREKGARKLAKRVRALSKKGPVHIIGHSHGGNVANDAACMLNWSSRQRRKRIASLTTVGTPFFRTRVTAGERFGAWFFIVLTFLSVLLIPPMLAFAHEAASQVMLIEAKSTVYIEPGAQDKREETQAAQSGEVRKRANAAAGLVTTLALASLGALVFMVPLGFRGVGRIRRAGRRARADTSLLSIWHPNDEAIAFLSRLEGLRIEPFPRWSMLRGSRTGAIIWGVRAVMLIPLASALFLILGAFGVEGAFALGLGLLIIGIAMAPLLFAIVYVFYRLFAALVLELGVRGVLNKTVDGALKGVAFGRDGDNRIGDVSTCSHYYSAERVELSGPVAQRMLEGSTEATRRLFDKYRASLFQVGTDQSNAINELAQDAMTWDSLVHTTYFDQPEVADLIGDYIARVEKGAPA